MNGVIYARYSSDNQREESIDGQLRDCKAYAEKNGIQIVDTYIDRAFSAKTDHRPAFQTMIKDSAKGRFGVILVWKLDRFARNRYDSAKYKNILKRNDVKLISATEAISDGAEGIILEAVLEGMAEYYSVELAEKITRGMRESAYHAKYNGAGVPLGYKIDADKKYQLDDVNVPAVQEIFKQYASGAQIADIMRSINAKGYRTCNGNLFNHAAISRILQNRKYLGEYRWHDIVIEGGIPRIISNELFDMVQKRLQAVQSTHAKRRIGDVPYLLTGKLYCGKCKSPMIGDSGTGKNNKKFYYYTCANRKKGRKCNKKSVRKDWLEKEVVRLTANYVLKDEMIEYISAQVAAYSAAEAADNSALDALKSNLSRVQKSIKNIMSAIESGVVAESTGKRLRELEAEERQLRFDFEKEKNLHIPVEKESVAEFLRSFKGGNAEDVDFQRQIIDTFVGAIYLYDDKLIITYNYSGGCNQLSASFLDSVSSDSPPPPCSDSVCTLHQITVSPNTTLFLHGAVFGLIAKITGRI